jgi:sugar lactone lactonase YvrE
MEFQRKYESARSCGVKCASRVLLICAALLCGAAPAARAASALWIADADNLRVDEYLPGKLKKSHAPTPVTISIGAVPNGVCFDQSKNLWVADESNEIFEFTAKSLKKLPATPTPAVTISSSSFEEIEGCAFDKNGNLWLADLDNNSLDEVSTTQLKASGSITPAIIITDTAEMSSAAPGFVTFDKSGNLWTDGRDDEELFEFSASQLTSGGNQTAAVVLGGGGSFSDPGQIGFDGKGNLWVTSYEFDTVVMFPKSDLASSNNDAPAVTIDSSSLDGPWGLGFSNGNLWIVNYNSGNADKFVPNQLKTSGAPVPKVILTGAAAEDSWQITFGPALGK